MIYLESIYRRYILYNLGNTQSVAFLFPYSYDVWKLRAPRPAARQLTI